jgi:rfaE bifunctional protein nucleotidyltransferase chain/domain
MIPQSLQHPDIYTRNDEQYLRQLAIWRFQNKKTVFTNGCFDILHLGHIDYLSKARKLGDILIVGLNTDASVSALKGSHRPLQNEISRAIILTSLRFVDVVVFFGESTPLALIETTRPDILVKGADYKPAEIVGYDIVTSYGGNVVTIPFLEGYSTTAIEQKILNSNPH